MKRSSAVLLRPATVAVLVAGGLLVPMPAAAATSHWGAGMHWASDGSVRAGQENPAVSADGRFVVFGGRTKVAHGIWVKEALSGTEAAYVLPGSYFNPDISADGSTLAFTQFGSGHFGLAGQTFVLDWRTDGAQPEAVTPRPEVAESLAERSNNPSLSADGRYVAFQSTDGDLDSAYADPAVDRTESLVYVHDRLEGATELVSVAPDEDDHLVPVDGQAITPAVSADGRFVAFASDSALLQGQPVGTPVVQQVFVRDLVADETYPVSVGPAPVTSAASAGPVFGDAASALYYGPSISDDGTRVAFESDATNLVPGDTNGDTDAFVFDVDGGVERVSVDSSGAQVDLPATAEAEAAQPLSSTPATWRKPKESGGGGAGELDGLADPTPNVGLGPVISGDGRYVVFESKAALTPDDRNGFCGLDGQVVDGLVCEAAAGAVVEEPVDVYRVDLRGAVPRPARMSVAGPGGTEATGYVADRHTADHGDEAVSVVTNGADPAVSANGMTVAFVSNGNLTGHVLAEPPADDGDGCGGCDGTHEEPAPTDPTVSAAAVNETAVEPNVYVRDTTVASLPVDRTPPESRASGPSTSISPSWTVTYGPVEDPSGVRSVELFVRRPGGSSYTSAGRDTTEQDGRFRFRSGGVEGAYEFYTVATDNAGNVEAVPTEADVVTTYADVTTPESRASSPRLTADTVVAVEYDADDGRDGSGVERVDLYVRPRAASQFVLAGADEGQEIDGVFEYDTGGDGVFLFYTLATDEVGNVEAAPDVADTRTRVDTTAPVIKRRMGKGPFAFDIRDDRRLEIRYRVNERVRTRLVIRHAGEVVKRARPAEAARGLVARYWLGRAGGMVVPNGRYVLVVRARDMAGNAAALRTPVRVSR